MTPLLLGTAIAIAALAFVLFPLLSDAPPPARPARHARPVDEDDTAIAALREIEFDRATGKLSDADYESLSRTYTARAVGAMRAADAAAVHEADAAEALIARYSGAPRTCASCGPRPESDAIYCSSCGNYLPGACASCGASVEVSGARFCPGCGHALAA